MAQVPRPLDSTAGFFFVTAGNIESFNYLRKNRMSRKKTLLLAFLLWPHLLEPAVLSAGRAAVSIMDAPSWEPSHDATQTT